VEESRRESNEILDPEFYNEEVKIEVMLTRREN
jgi:hypothetical protein